MSSLLWPGFRNGEHETALADAPPDHSNLHRRYAAMVDRGEKAARRLWEELGRLDRQIAKTGGLRQVRPETRRAHRDLLATRDATHTQLEATQEQLRSDRTSAHRAGSAVDEHARWAQPTSGATRNSTASTGN